MDRGFIASMFRSAAGAAARDLRSAVEARTNADRERMQEEIARAVKDRSHRFEELQRQVAEFEETSGIKISDGLFGYGSKEIGAAVKLIRQSGVLSTYGGIHSLVKQAETFAERAKRLLEEGGFVAEEDEAA